MPVRFAIVDAARVFNLTSPRFIPEIAKYWTGELPWFHPRYEPVRDICESSYIAHFNAITGHYRKLEASIRAEGIRNPVVLTTGGLVRRSAIELPPDVRRRADLPVCEYVGGSRLLVAARLGLKVPAIVNDFANVFAGDAITTTDELLAHFADRPRTIEWRPGGWVYVNHLPYTHYEPSNRITVKRQIAIRAEVIRRVRCEVNEWMVRHDK